MELFDPIIDDFLFKINPLLLFPSTLEALLWITDWGTAFTMTGFVGGFGLIKIFIISFDYKFLHCLNLCN